MRTQAHGEHQRDFSQFCRYHGFQLRAWAPRCPVHPPAWPRRGFPLRVASLTVIALPEVEKGWGGSSWGGRTAGQLLHFLLEAWPPHPCPGQPHPEGLPPPSRLACLSGTPPRPRLGSGSSQRHPLPH